MNATAEPTLAVRPQALRGVPPFPPVAARLMRLVSDADEDFSYKDIGDLIRTDAAFSVEVLRLSNSPVFGFRYEIRDIPHAIAVLGLNRLRAIVTTLAMREFMAHSRQSESIQRSWRHNLATALACESLAGAFWLDSGFGYTAGLLHDIGLLAMISTNAEAYADLLNSTVRGPLEFLERERTALGLDHCEAGSWLLGDWGLPEEFRDVAANHHEEGGEQSSDMTRLVHLGCLTASMAGFPVCNAPSVWEPEIIVQELPEKIQDRYRGLLGDLPMTIATKINSFDCDFLS